MGNSFNPRRWGHWAAVVVPLVVYIATGAGHGYWLDSGEFTAAAVGLDISHPPGHPLFVLWSTPFTWLPVGPLPFRVAVGQAVAAALSLWFVHRALLRTVLFAGIENELASSLLTLAGSWLLAGSYGYWFQAVRAEVYALQALLVCIAFERISLWATTRDEGDPRPLFGACLALGFGLANHHLIAVLAMPVLLWPAYDALRRHGVRAIVQALGFGLVGCASYVYLPLRAATEPRMDLGHPTSLADFLWVVSARIYARYTGAHARQPAHERFADLLVLLYENFFPPVLFLAVVGGYFVLRQRRMWPLASLWWVAALVSLAGRAWLNEVRANPDVLGYMMPGFFALVALAACGWALPVEQLGLAAPGRRAPFMAASFWLIASVWSASQQYERASLASFHATDAFADLRRRALPTRSVVILTTPESVFRFWEGESVEQLRADIVTVPLPFLGYGSSDRVLLHKHPELAPIVEDFARTGALTPPALEKLARARPVFVELDNSTTLPLYGHMLPDALLFRVASEASAATALRERLRARRQLYARLGDQTREPETQKALLWLHYTEALYFSARGALPAARDAIDRGLALAPQAEQLRKLQAALRHARPGTLDLTPYLTQQP